MFETVVQFFKDIASTSLSINAEMVQKTLTTTMNNMLNSETLERLYNYVVTIGVLILIVYMLLDLYDKVTHESVSIDSFFFAFLKAIVFYLIMKHGLDILKGVNGIADWSTSLIIGASKDSTDVMIGAAFTNKDTPKDFIHTILALIQGLGSSTSILEVMIYAIVSNVVVYFVAFDRVVSAGLQIIMGPFQLADISGHGFSVSAKHYLVEMFKIFMQEPIIVLTVIFLPYVSKAYDLAGLSGSMMFSSLVSVFALAKLLNSSKTMASDIF